MNNLQSALWTKLASFQIDEGDEALTFEKRLARENGWTVSHSRRVIEEYKRFVFLCAAAGHGCTPSDEVDQAWHLHICYTRSYWDRMCGDLLPQPLHHNPTKGGRDEGAKFEDWYERTLASYRELFGQEPPPDIWPRSQSRFAEDEHCKRIDTRQNWVIPKRPARWMAGLVFLAGVAGCSRTTADAIVGSIMCFGMIALIIALAAASQVGKSTRRGQGGSSCGSTGGSTGCSSGSFDSGSDCGGGDSGGGSDGGGGCGSGCGGGCGGGCGS